MKKTMNVIGNPWGQRISILVLIMICMLIFEPRFFRLENASSILLAISLYGIMACGMLFVVLVAGIDLSVGSTAGLAAAILVLFSHNSGFTTGGFLVGLLVAVAACVLIGVVHGILVTRFNIPAFVVTLATKYVIYGAVLLVSKGAFIMISGEGISEERDVQVRKSQTVWGYSYSGGHFRLICAYLRVCTWQNGFRQKAIRRWRQSCSIQPCWH